MCAFGVGENFSDDSLTEEDVSEILNTIDPDFLNENSGLVAYVRRFVNQYDSVLSKKTEKLNHISYKFEVQNEEPVKESPYPLPQSLKRELKILIYEFLRIDIILKSQISYRYAAFIARNRNKSLRIVANLKKSIISFLKMESFRLI